jgi:hypothetical protein
VTDAEAVEACVQIALEYRDEIDTTTPLPGEHTDHLLGQAFAANIIAKRIRARLVLGLSTTRARARPEG